MNETYQQLRTRQQTEYNAFANKKMFYAITNKHYLEAIAKWGMTEDEAEKQLYSLSDTFAFIRRVDSPTLHTMMERFDTELKEFKKNKENLVDMFVEELGNHEYCVTYDLQETLDECGITKKDLRENQELFDALKIAVKTYLKKMAEAGY